MHEMGIAMEVARIAREEAAVRGAIRVVSLRLRVGGWSGVEPESLRFALETLTSPGICDPGDLLEGARVEFEWVEPRFHCPACGREYEAEGYLEPCPLCGALGGQLIRGEELDLAEIELEDG